MADIELVIKVPEEIRLALIDNIPLSVDQQSIRDSYIKHAIINGTPLPKGHGRLIDGDYLYKKFVANKCLDSLVLQFIKDELTIIETDKGENED